MICMNDNGTRMDVDSAPEPRGDAIGNFDEVVAHPESPPAGHGRNQHETLRRGPIHWRLERDAVFTYQSAVTPARAGSN